MSDDEIKDGAGLIHVPKRSTIAAGAVALFVADVKAAFGDAFVTSWLSSTTCLFEETVIWTSDIGAATLTRQCERLLEKHAVRVRCDDLSRAHFRRQTNDVIAKTDWKP